MSLNRFNPRRDENEPAIRKRFATHGWHTEQLSGAGMPDLLCWPRLYPIHQEGPRAMLVDVKMPGKKATNAQVEKWTALSGKGIPVYVASTEADVDAIVGGTATPWAPEGPRGRVRSLKTRGMKKAVHYVVPRPGFTPPRSPPVDASATSLGAEVMREMMKPPGEENYAAAVARSLRAAEQAAETFAPPQVLGDPCQCRPGSVCSLHEGDACSVPGCINVLPCPRHALITPGRK